MKATPAEKTLGTSEIQRPSVILTIRKRCQSAVQRSVSSCGNEHAFISSGIGITDLNNLIDPSLGLTLTDALQINDNGQILAWANDSNGSGILPLKLRNPI